MSASDILAALLSFNIAATVGILAVIPLRRLVRRLAGARAAYALWLIPLLAGAAALLPARSGDVVPVTSAPIQPMVQALIDAADVWTTPPAALPAADTEPSASPLDIAAIGLAAWAVGALGFLTLILIRQHRSLKSFGSMTHGANGLRASANGGPAIIGVVRPQLVLPSDFEERFSERERELILAHEHTHLSGGDTRINAALALLVCINWFNPLVHIAVRLARKDQELACDAAVVERYPGERRIYAEALLKTQLAPASLPLGCTWPPRSSSLLKERVTMLARKSPSSRRRAVGALLVAVAATTAGLFAWAQTPPLQAFAGRIVTCDAWAAKYSNDPKIKWEMFKPEGPVILYISSDGRATIQTPQTFPADVYPKSSSDGPSAIMHDPDTVAGRKMRKDFIENVTFTGLSGAAPQVKWQRIRIDETGSHEVFISAGCRN